MIVVRMVDVRAFVYDFARITRHAKAVGKAGRDIQLTEILVRQLHGNPLPERRRPLSHVDRDVEYRASNTPYQLSLWIPELIVQSTHRAAYRPGVVVLGKTYRQPRVSELLLVKRLEKEATIV